MSDREFGGELVFLVIYIGANVVLGNDDLTLPKGTPNAKNAPGLYG